MAVETKAATEAESKPAAAIPTAIKSPIIITIPMAAIPIAVKAVAVEASVAAEVAALPTQALNALLAVTGLPAEDSVARDVAVQLPFLTLQALGTVVGLGGAGSE